MNESPPLNILKNYIKINNLRYTEQRELILKYFLLENKHICAEELYEKINKKHPEIGIATVHRALNLFVDCKIANKLKFGDSKYVYEVKHSHHDHLICLECGRIIEFKENEIEKLQEKVAKNNNFIVRNHRLEIYGICKECQEK